MNAQRAKEIAESAEMADVSYYGVPVYIQHVNVGAETARIYPIDRPQEEQTVPVDTLTEGFNTETDLPFV